MANPSIWERIRAWFGGSPATASPSGFVAIHDAHGSGLVDAETVRVATSTAPDPTQRDLTALFAAARRVRVVDLDLDEEADAPRDGGRFARPLFDTRDPAGIAALGAVLAIREDPETFGHCMCMGGPAIEVWDGDRVRAQITLHHGRSIRWDAWCWDAVLVDGDALCDWLAARGVTGPKEEVAMLERIDADSHAQWERWLAAMPPCLTPLWEAAVEDEDNGAGDAYAALAPALRAAFPEAHARIVALLRWFGAGAGAWSGFPSYESIAESLLLEHGTDELVAAAEASLTDAAALEGAARHHLADAPEGGVHPLADRPPDGDSIGPRVDRGGLTRDWSPDWSPAARLCEDFG